VGLLRKGGIDRVEFMHLVLECFLQDLMAAGGAVRLRAYCNPFPWEPTTPRNEHRDRNGETRLGTLPRQVPPAPLWELVTERARAPLAQRTRPDGVHPGGRRPMTSTRLASMPNTCRCAVGVNAPGDPTSGAVTWAPAMTPTAGHSFSVGPLRRAV